MPRNMCVNGFQKMHSQPQKVCNKILTSFFLCKLHILSFCLKQKYTKYIEIIAKFFSLKDSSAFSSRAYPFSCQTSCACCCCLPWIKFIKIESIQAGIGPRGQAAAGSRVLPGME